MIKRRKIYSPELWRRRTKIVGIGSVKIGWRYPVSIQTMTKTDTRNVSATVRQIKQLEKAGCEIVRVAVKNKDCARALNRIKSKINIPLVADIHFDYCLALEAIERGIDGLRLNPGNIYRREEVRQIAKVCRKRKIPIRVGVNAGSLRSQVTGHKSQVKRYKKENTVDLMVKSALDYIKMLESFNFYDIIVSLKASSVVQTVSAYRRLAGLCNYPFHLGITTTGLPEEGAIKSAVGIGSLLLEGIGDTIRVSLAGSPRREVEIARQILQALDLRYFGPVIIACPTCGRAQADVIKIAERLSERLEKKVRLDRKQPLKVAIMGCEVNGPGEARDADIGVACGRGSGVLFKKGKIVKKLKASQIVETLIKELVNS